MFEDVTLHWLLWLLPKYGTLSTPLICNRRGGKDFYMFSVHAKDRSSGRSRAHRTFIYLAASCLILISWSIIWRARVLQIWVCQRLSSRQMVIAITAVCTFSVVFACGARLHSSCKLVTLRSKFDGTCIGRLLTSNPGPSYTILQHHC